VKFDTRAISAVHVDANVDQVYVRVTDARKHAHGSQAICHALNTGTVIASESRTSAWSADASIDHEVNNRRQRHAG
jgi:hypothetical protein